MPPKAKKPRKQPARKCKESSDDEFQPEVENSISTSPEPPKSKKAKLEEDKINVTPGKFVSENKGKLEKHYKVRQVLGEGSFGRVCTATHKATRQKRAIKTINKENLSEESLADFLAEVDTLASMDHPHILKVYEYFEEEDCYHLVTELCEGGDMFDYITDSEFISERLISSIMDQLLRAMNYCHSRHIVHRDLKPENIMLEARPSSEDELFSIKVIDYGLAALRTPGTTLCDEVGTTDFMSPQVVSNGKYTEKCDIWSLGVILYTLLVGYPPFKSKSEAKLAREIMKGEVCFDSDEWQEVSDDARDLV